MRPRSRTLTAVNLEILSDVVFPSNITAKSIRVTLDGKKHEKSSKAGEQKVCKDGHCKIMKCDNGKCQEMEQDAATAPAQNQREGGANFGTQQDQGALIN